MAITSTLTTSFKKELLTATHNFATNGNAFKLAFSQVLPLWEQLQLLIQLHKK